jgi:hypothetical protein
MKSDNGNKNLTCLKVFKMDNCVYFFNLKVPKGNPYHSATSGEMAIYRANSIILKKVI